MMGFYLGLVILTFIAWETLKIASISLKGFKLNLGARKRRTVEAGIRPFHQTPRTQEYIEELISMGFHILGNTQTPISANYIPMVQVLLNPENTVQVELTVSSSMVEFSSIFREDVLIVTDFPRGEHINRPTYQSHTITTSLEEAYRYHLQQVELYTRKFGNPQIIQNMADHLKWERMGRVLYGNIKLRRYLMEDIFGAVICIFIIIAIGLFLYLYWPTKVIVSTLNPDSVRLKAELVTIVFTSIAIYLRKGLARLHMKQMRKDSRGKLKVLQPKSV